MPTLERDGDVFVLDLGDGDNRFNQDLITSINAALDEVTAAPTPRALVIGATGKIWCNGLDLDWLAANLDVVPQFVRELHELLARILELPVPTVAAIQGHCFAGGAMLAIACDERVMREDRGYFCLPEIDIRIPFTPGMAALIRDRLLPQVARESMTTGRRYGGSEALEAAIVEFAVPEEKVLPLAIERAARLAEKDPATLGVIKQRLHAPAIAMLRDEDANRISALGD